MKGRTVALLLVSAAFALAVCATGCKTFKRAPAPAPNEQNFRAAAEKYFLDNGYKKVAEGRYEITDSATGAVRTEVLQFDPTRLIKYDNPNYPWQGIVSRKTITKAKDKEDAAESPFIMYWSAKAGAWEHLFGTDIPQPGKHK